jgi:hypothetical protein
LIGGDRDGGLVFEQEREAFAEFDDEAGPELAREVDFDEADIGAGETIKPLTQVRSNVHPRGRRSWPISLLAARCRPGEENT